MTKTTITMDRMPSRSFLCCLLFLVFTGTKGQGSQCLNGWFGNNCQYQCHCLNDAVCNKITGECPGSCDGGWFGHQCQYLDAAYNNSNVLTDGNEATCLSGDGRIYQDFKMSFDVRFTWMRIVMKNAGVFDSTKMKFYSTIISSSSWDEVVPKSPLTKIYVSDTILELHGELQDRFDYIRLEFDTNVTKSSFCSMQVSSGRNVAIKQTASQSSLYLGGPEKAIDGKSSQNWNQDSCSSTEREESPYWILNLSLPVTVNMYRILSPKDLWARCRLRHFRLESYYVSTKVQQYDHKSRVDQINYVYSENASLINSVMLHLSKSFWPGGQYNCSLDDPSLSFCEMEIFGDVVCQQGKWGRDCEKDCNCRNPSEHCFVSTGMCSSGCKAGFHWPGCQEECNPRYYGQDCATLCSDKCRDQFCHHISGECYDCPDGIKLSKDCSKECDHGFYGYNCTRACPTNCLNNKCDNVHGTCTQCVAGYHGPKCEQECNPRYYGQGCATLCSDKCIDQLCNHISGMCDDCPVGIQLSEDCSKECDPGFYGYKCWQICSANCLKNTCNNVDGTCTKCVAGYQGPRCEQACSNNTYGEDCNRTCSVNCVANAIPGAAVCGHVQGQCLLGCVSGYSGITCEEITSDPDELNLAKILVPILFGIVVVTALVIGICVWRRRKAQHDGGKIVEDIGSRNRPDGVHEPEILSELENQSSNVRDAVDDHYERISLTPNERAPDITENEKRSPYVNDTIPAINRHDKNNPYSNVENPPIHEYDRISPYVNEENVPYNEYEKTGENRESQVYTELVDK